jgi:hypothetical protein
MAWNVIGADFTWVDEGFQFWWRCDKTCISFGGLENSERRENRFIRLIDIGLTQFILLPLPSFRYALSWAYFLEAIGGRCRELDGYKRWHSSAVERHLGKVEVQGSIPCASLNRNGVKDV